MGFRHAISDADWDRVQHRLPGRPGRHGGVAEDNRRFLDAVSWVARRRMAEGAVANLLAGLRGEPLPTPVTSGAGATSRPAASGLPPTAG